MGKAGKADVGFEPDIMGIKDPNRCLKIRFAQEE